MNSAMKWFAVAVVVAVAGIALVTFRHDVGRERRFDPARDSITVRAYFKSWGPFHLPEADVEWHPDSGTVRLRAPGDITFQTRIGFGESWDFPLVRVLSPESAWVRTDRGLRPLGRWSWRSDPQPDSILITRDVRWWSTISFDGGTFVGLRMVPEWTSRRASSDTRLRTHSIVGRVVDAMTGRPCRPPWGERGKGLPTANLREAWGTASTDADSLGYFKLRGLREGWMKLNVSAVGYAFASRIVRVPADTLIVRLIGGSPIWPFGTEIEAPSARPIIVPVPGSRRPPRKPLEISGRWQASSNCVSPFDPRCADESGVYIFYAPPGSAEDRSCSVEWWREGDRDSTAHVPLETRRGGRLWASAQPTERGGLGWEFAVIGDTLAGQLIDPSTRVVSREFHAVRISESSDTAGPSVARHRAPRELTDPSQP